MYTFVFLCLFQPNRTWNLKYFFLFYFFSKLKRDSMLVELPDDDNAADLILQQKEDEIRKMQDLLSKMQHQLQVQQRSRSLGEAQLKHEFSLMNIDKSQEVRL